MKLSPFIYTCKKHGVYPAKLGPCPECVVEFATDTREYVKLNLRQYYTGVAFFTETEKRIVECEIAGIDPMDYCYVPTTVILPGNIPLQFMAWSKKSSSRLEQDKTIYAPIT